MIYQRSPMLDRIIRDHRNANIRQIAVDTIAFLAAIFAAIMILSGRACADEWTKTDTAYEAATIGVIAVDWMQTSSFRSSGLAETNPILGLHPTQTRINVVIGASMLAHVAIARLLPNPYRRAFQAITITMELGATTNNALFGAGLTLPW